MMSLAGKVLNQFRKPTGWLGRLNLWDMNRRHSKLTDWGLKHISIENDDTILDVGCGGGRTVHKLAAIAREGKTYGIDHSKESVAASRRTNRPWIEMGRVEIQHGSVSRLPFSDQMFDLATAVETHYYWPDLPADMREVLRVLKPGGTLIIIAEAYKGGKHDEKLQRLVEVMKTMNYAYAHLSVDDHRKLFSKACYSDVQVFEEHDKGWICGVGRKPSWSLQAQRHIEVGERRIELCCIDGKINYSSLKFTQEAIQNDLLWSKRAGTLLPHGP